MKRQTKRKIMALVMAALMVVGLIPTGFAAKAVSAANNVYTFDASAETAITTAEKKTAIASGKYGTEGYFTLSGTVTRGNSDTFSAELAKGADDKEEGALTFTVTGTADVVVTATSTGSSNTSDLALVDASGNKIDGIKAVTGTKPVTEIKYTNLAAGTYSIIAPKDGENNRGVRVLSAVVTEIAAAVVTSDYTFDALVKKEKRTVIEDGKEVTKEVDVNYISSKIEDNLKSFYMFYTPFEGESTTEHYNQESITSKLVSDKINITYDVPSEITGEIVEYSDLNVYVLEQEKIVKTSSVFESMHVDKDKVTVSKCINGAVASTPLTDKIQVYSNIKNWALKNDVNNKNVLYRMTVRVWQWKDEYNHTDKQPSADSAIATVTTTKEN